MSWIVSGASYTANARILPGNLVDLARQSWQNNFHSRVGGPQKGVVWLFPLSFISLGWHQESKSIVKTEPKITRRDMIRMSCCHYFSNHHIKIRLTHAPREIVFTTSWNQMCVLPVISDTTCRKSVWELASWKSPRKINLRLLDRKMTIEPLCWWNV